MRITTAISSTLLALPLLASAQYLDQIQSILAKVQSYIPAGPGSSTSPEAAAEAVRKNVVPVTLDNWQSTFMSPRVQEVGGEWFLYITGGNKTCFGMCAEVDKAWNESTLILSKSPHPPNLAMLDCESQPVLCNAWASNPSSLWHIIPGKEKTALRMIELNRTTTTPETFVKIYQDKEWEVIQPYEGFFHPFDGPLIKLGLVIPMGYVLWFFGLVPSWAMMLLISFGSRTFMSRRSPARPARPAGAAAGAAPAAARPAR